MANDGSPHVGGLIEPNGEKVGSELAGNVDIIAGWLTFRGQCLIAAQAHRGRMIWVTFHHALVNVLELIDCAQALAPLPAMGFSDQAIVVKHSGLRRKRREGLRQRGIVLLLKDEVNAHAGRDRPHPLGAGAVEALTRWALFAAGAGRARRPLGAWFALRTLGAELALGAWLSLKAGFALGSLGTGRARVSAAAAAASEEGEEDEQFPHVSASARCQWALEVRGWFELAGCSGPGRPRISQTGLGW